MSMCSLWQNVENAGQERRSVLAAITHLIFFVGSTPDPCDSGKPSESSHASKYKPQSGDQLDYVWLVMYGQIIYIYLDWLLSHGSFVKPFDVCGEVLIFPFTLRCPHTSLSCVSTMFCFAFICLFVLLCLSFPLSLYMVRKVNKWKKPRLTAHSRQKHNTLSLIDQTVLRHLLHKHKAWCEQRTKNDIQHRSGLCMGSEGTEKKNTIERKHKNGFRICYLNMLPTVELAMM